MHKYRTHTCSELTKKDAGKTVKLSGWIHRKRDHGNLLFFDLRDHFGLTQCVTENNSNYFKEIEKIKPESVVCISGTVVGRSKDTINKDFELFSGLLIYSTIFISFLALLINFFSPLTYIVNTFLIFISLIFILLNKSIFFNNFK